jgi:tryptophan synthase beta chain
MNDSELQGIRAGVTEKERQGLRRQVLRVLDRKRGAVTATSVSPTGSPPLNVDPDGAVQGEIEPIELNRHNVRTTAGMLATGKRPVVGERGSRATPGAESGRDPTPAEAKVGIATPSAPNPPERRTVCHARPGGGGRPGPPTCRAGAGLMCGMDGCWVAWVQPPAGEEGAMDESVRQHKFVLEESEMPTTWYNLVPDLASPPPPALHPGTLEPAGPDDFAPLFPMDLILQEVSMDRYIEIPGAVLDVYRQWRPSPLFRAHRLERALDTPARIYYKYEGVSPAGSHKPNTAVPQAYYNAKAGVRKLTTETGAGQWGSALAFACALFGLECEVWQVGASYDQKPYRRLMMETFGATVHRSPSDLTESGRKYLAENPHHTGSLGIAISEAVEVAAQDPEIRYSLGSVLNHVLLHQTVIGEEALLQLAKAGEEAPDVIVGCTGGGSNFAGLSFPFLREKLAGKMSPTIRAVEPASCPSLTRGVYAYDFGDSAGMTPLMKMHTLGHDFIPDPIHAGGLRYHGMSPLLSHVYELGLIEAIAVPQMECFAAGIEFARNEGIVPAPEPTHAVAAAVREAIRAKETGEETVILTALCGHGHFDLAAYDDYLNGRMVDEDVTDERLEAGLATMPTVA